MKARIVRKLVAFNVNDAHQRDLLGWAESKTDNFSGFVKDVLFAYKCGNGISRPEVIPEAAAVTANEQPEICDIL